MSGETSSPLSDGFQFSPPTFCDLATFTITNKPTGSEKDTGWRRDNGWTHHTVIALWDVDTFHQQLHSGRLPNKHNQDVNYNAVYGM